MKVREIAAIESVAPCNRVKKANSSEVRVPYDNPLVITLRVGTLDVKRVICDDNSNTGVLFAEAYKGMKLKESRLMIVKMSTYGVSRKELLELTYGVVKNLPKETKKQLVNLLKMNID